LQLNLKLLPLELQAPHAQQVRVITAATATATDIAINHPFRYHGGKTPSVTSNILIAFTTYFFIND